MSIEIVADYREVPSKIPKILEELGAQVELAQLKTGDYIINNDVVIERKSKEDFILSIIQGRLFAQCARMKKVPHHLVLLIEGNPYNTNHQMDKQAIRGALLSVTISWQIPIIYSSSTDDSANMLLMIGNQLLKESCSIHRNGYKPKTPGKRAAYFLQGLPMVGPKLANAILERFDCLESAILATESELLEVEGLGKSKAKKIKEFLSFRYASTNKR